MPKVQVLRCWTGPHANDCHTCKRSRSYKPACQMRLHHANSTSSNIVGCQHADCDPQAGILRFLNWCVLPQALCADADSYQMYRLICRTVSQHCGPSGLCFFQDAKCQTSGIYFPWCKAHCCAANVGQCQWVTSSPGTVLSPLLLSLQLCFVLCDQALDLWLHTLPSCSECCDQLCLGLAMVSHARWCILFSAKSLLTRHEAVHPREPACMLQQCASYSRYGAHANPCCTCLADFMHSCSVHPEYRLLGHRSGA